MVNNNIKYNRALVRILFELERALSYRNGVNESVTVAPTTWWSFFSYAYLAMYDSMFFHAIKILDEHKDVASFWYLWRCNPKDIERLLSKHNLTINEIEVLSKKLIIVRDKTHFHIDKSEIFHTDDVWKRADITGNIFNKVMDNLWNVLRDLHHEQFGRDFIQPIYQGEDIKSIIEAAKEKGITI